MNIMGKRYFPTLVLVFAIFFGFYNGEVQARFTQKIEDGADMAEGISQSKCKQKMEDGADTEVEISPNCAAVLLSGGAMGGASLAYAMTPAALCTAGFCPAGVSAGSFASWWQSTIPLVSAGGLFATLQSVAMGGVGTKIMLAGSVLGSSLSAKYLCELCTFVDDPDSPMAPVFDANLSFVRGANQAADKVKAVCSSSESCSAAADLAQSASASVSSLMSSIWNGVVQTAEAVSNKAEKLLIEKDIERLKEHIKDLKDNTYTGNVIEKARYYPSSHQYLNWLSGGVVESIFTLEKELKDLEVRLLDLNAKSNE